MSTQSDSLSQKLSWYFNNANIFPEIDEDHLNAQKHFLVEAKKLEDKIVQLEKELSDLSWRPLPQTPPTGH